MTRPSSRRQFRLPAEDEAALSRVSESWEAITEGQARWVLVHNLAIEVPPTYPHDQADQPNKEDS